MRIAQRFNAGKEIRLDQVPKGRLNAFAAVPGLFGTLDGFTPPDGTEPQIRRIPTLSRNLIAWC